MGGGGGEQPFTKALKQSNKHIINHILSMILWGRKVFTHAIFANSKIYMHDFFLCGGHREFVWGGGGHVPPQAPVATPLDVNLLGNKTCMIKRA